MAGPYKLTLKCMKRNNNGMRDIHGYIAANQAVNVFSPVDVSRPALVTDLQSFDCPEDLIVIDAICDSATGVLELYSGGIGTGITFDAASHGATNSGRPKLSIPLGRGKRYSLMTKVIFPA